MKESHEVQRGESASDPPAMIRVIRVCRKCGAKVFSDAPEGLCTGCVLEAAIGANPEKDEDSAADVEVTEVTSASDKKKSTRVAELLGELGDYELLEEVGRGGQGVVFRARQKSLNRIVALKVISLGQWASKAHLKRFRLEAEAAAKLEHPGIVPIHEVGERDGSCYFSMKFVEGGQLDEVARREPMPIRRAVELIAKVARTVHYAHEHGILHRDIKPGNILLDAKGEPHLTDFGLARLVESESSVTQTMDVLGTPSYMAPEQAVGNNAAIGSVTDIYGLGAVLYQLLTGQPPFAGGATYETIKLLLDTEPRPPRLLNPKIDHDLSTICLKCLEKDPKCRYSSALALAEDLERWLKHEPILARHTGVFARGRKWVRRNPTSAILAASLVALALAAGWIVWKSELVRQPVTTGIAVLPFENLSDQKENATFADGVHDDILTKLAKIADLKVISRTSVMEYRGKRNIREIGDALRVSHVLEGSARRNGSLIRLNAQLIDTRTDTHLWAEQYDRNLNDLFAIQSEIAQKVAEHLGAKISAAEKMTIARPPTTDLTANDLYTQAMVFESQSPMHPNFVKAIRLLEQAVTRDPRFVLAYCALARMNFRLYLDGYDHTLARLELAQAAIHKAAQLQPEAGEVHLERAGYDRGVRDYDGARVELELARRALPNNPAVYHEIGSIDWRQGRWTEAVRNFERAIELDPRNVEFLVVAANAYSEMRRYPEAAELFRRAVSVSPHNYWARVIGAWQPFRERADIRPIRAALNAIVAEESDAAPKEPGDLFQCAIFERDAAAADRALAAIPSEGMALGPNLVRPREWFVGYVAQLFNRPESARRAFEATRAILEKLLREQPENAAAWSLLGRVEAALGRKEEAIKAGRRGCELLPLSREPASGTRPLRELAIIYAWVGEKDLALEQLATSAGQVMGVSYGALQLDPDWDSLRGDPRFERIVTSLAPKEIVSK